MLEMVLRQRVLVGPLLDAEQIGDWIKHPQMRAFHDPKALLRPPGWEALVPADPPADCDWIPYYYGESLPALLSRLGDWEPELILWWGFAYTVLPAGLESAPCPVVLIASDWQSCAHEIWRWREYFDLILGDQGLVQWLQARQYPHCAWWPGYGFSPRRFRPRPDLPKCWDLTYVGSLNPDTHPERMRCLRQLMPLQEHFRLCLSDQIQGPAYAQILSQSRLVFNHSLRGEMNLRAFEAPACGALLLQEENNLEIARFLRPGKSCVLYRAETLLSTVRALLEAPEQLESMARAGQQEIQAFSYTHQFTQLLRELPHWLQQRGRSARRTPVSLEMRRRQALIPALNSAQRACLKETVPPTPQADQATRHSQCCMQLTLQEHSLAALKCLEQLCAEAPTQAILLHNLAWGSRLCQQTEAEILSRTESALTQMEQENRLTAPAEFLAWVLPLTGAAAFRLAWEQGLKDDDRERLQGLLRWNLLRLKAEICLKQRPDLSLIALEAAVLLPASPPTLWLPLARLYLHFGWYAQALKALEQARSHLPLQREIWQTALQASLKYGDYDTTRLWLREALPMASLLPAWQDAHPVWEGLARQLGIR